jgi:hypothetical protein
MSFDHALNQAPRTQNSFKFKEGQNRFRILTNPELHMSEYNGNPTMKFVCHIIDRADALIKLAFLPKTVYQSVVDLQKSEDYSFEEAPMPYDVTVSARGAGTKEVMYTVMPTAPSELTETEIINFNEATPISEILERLAEKDAQKKES